jgi:hypothetical protein
MNYEFMKCGPDDNFTNLFFADGKYQNLSDPMHMCGKNRKYMFDLQ